MKTRFLIIIGTIGLASMFASSPVYASFADSISIHVSGDFRNLYYNEKNVTSVFFDPTSDSVIFETGSNAELEIKAPKIYKTGPNLLILENGEEISPEIITDDCFYYVSIQTKIPEKIEIAYTFWSEYPETITSCETINVSPLKQFKAGVRIDKIQCSESLQIILKTDGTPACVKPDSIEKLREYGWTNSKILSDEIVREKILELTGLLESGHVAEFNELKTELVAFVLLERVDAAGMNLDGINLEHTSLPGANLHNATLRGANIGNADLSNANLQGSNLKDADLFHTRLWGANLHGANLQDSNLEGVSFRGADLTQASLQNANLQNADLPITANLSNADFSNAKNLPISIDEAIKRGALVD